MRDFFDVHLVIRQEAFDPLVGWRMRRLRDFIQAGPKKQHKKSRRAYTAAA